MLDTFWKLVDILDKTERRRSIYVFAMILMMGFLEVTSVASIMPFIAVLSNPEVIQKNGYLSYLYEVLSFENTNDFLIFLGSGVFLITLGGLIFKSLTSWVMTRFTYMLNYSFGSRLLRHYLRRPYSFFLNRHSSDLSRSVLSEVSQVINKSLRPMLEFVANLTVAICLVVFVIAVNPYVAAYAVLVLGGSYALIYLFLRRYLTKIGRERVSANQERYKIAQEAVGGIKDVKVLGLEEGYIRSFRGPAYRFASAQANSQVISEIPQYALQALVFGGILLLLLTLLATRGNDLSAVLPLIVVYVVTGSRLNPALKSVYKSLTSMRFGKPALELLHRDLVGPDDTTVAIHDKSAEESDGDAIELQERLTLANVTYVYPGAERAAIKNLDLEIPANTTVGFAGSTGAGKTTVVDIILGLLEPQKGRLYVDGVEIAGTAIRAWQRNIGYVPQQIFLTDDTVAANIAFGVEPSNIDHEAVERAAKVAELHEFVVEEMPRGYDTLVGERGVRLSGGQRQRIGIARALYRDPDILVLDEATSALDNLTERVVLDAVNNLSREKTIIVIAHRLSTIKQCDTIFVLEGGCLVGSGKYEELIKDNDRFSAMAAAH